MGVGDAELESIIQELGQLLEEAPEKVEEAFLLVWRARFDQALQGAERGPEWPRLAAMARAVEGRIAARTALLEVERDEVRKILAGQAQGARALKAYRPSDS